MTTRDQVIEAAARAVRDARKAWLVVVDCDEDAEYEASERYDEAHDALDVALALPPDAPGEARERERALVREAARHLNERDVAEVIAAVDRTHPPAPAAEASEAVREWARRLLGAFWTQSPESVDDGAVLRMGAVLARVGPPPHR